MTYEIKTERLTLRPLGTKDLETTHRYASDPETTRYMCRLPNADEAETAAFLAGIEKEWAKESPDVYEFAVLLDGRHVGAVSAAMEGETAELGWIFHKDYWRRGYAFEAAQAVKTFLVETLQVKRIIAHCDARNERSYHLMEKLGLKKEKDDGVRQYQKRDEVARELTYGLDVAAEPKGI